MSAEVAAVLREMLGSSERLQVRWFVVERIAVLMVDQVSVRQRPVSGFPGNDSTQSPPARLCDLDPCPHDPAVLAKADSSDRAPVLRPLAPAEFGRRASSLASRDGAQPHVSFGAARTRAVVGFACFCGLALERRPAHRACAGHRRPLAPHPAFDDDGVRVKALRRAEDETTRRPLYPVRRYVDLGAACPAGCSHALNYSGTGTTAFVVDRNRDSNRRDGLQWTGTDMRAFTWFFRAAVQSCPSPPRTTDQKTGG
jgi:hypothetical protein